MLKDILFDTLQSPLHEKNIQYESPLQVSEIPSKSLSRTIRIRILFYQNPQKPKKLKNTHIVTHTHTNALMTHTNIRSLENIYKQTLSLI